MSSFNNLVKRVESLTEMADSFKQAVRGAAGGEGGLNVMLKAYRNEKTGKPVGAVSRVKNLIVLRALYDKDYINDAEFQALAKKATSSNYIANTLKEINPEAHEVLFGVQQKSDDIIKHIKVNAKDMLNFGLTNLQGKTYAEVQEDEPVDTDAKKLEDEVTDEVIRLAKGLTSSDVENTILDFDEADIYIDIPDQDIKRNVSSKITDYLNKQGLEAGISGVGVNVQAPVGFYGDRNMRDTFRDKFTAMVMEIDSAIPEDAIKVKFTDAGGTYEDNESYNREHGSVEEHYPEDKNPRTAHEDADEDELARQHEKDKAGPTIPGEYASDEEGSLGEWIPFEPIQKEVLADVTKAAGEFSHKAAKMADAAQKMYNIYGKRGDQEKAEIADELTDYFLSQSKFEDEEELTLESVYDTMGFIKAPVMNENGITSSTCSTQQYLTEATEQIIEESEKYTADYLTEQKEADSYTSAPKEKSVSFKERFKPKTQSQLEELRRYGL